ncbi:MAG: DNA-binding protein [Pyrobaculum sp.]
MSPASREAIADTSFLVDWARYSKRDLLFSVFEVVHVPESVLREIKLPPAIDWVAQSLAAGKMALFTETQDVENKARELMALSRGKPLKRIDRGSMPRRRHRIRLHRADRNGGAYYAPRVLGLGVTVWRAFEVLVEAWRLGLVGDLAGELKRYEEDYIYLRRRTGITYVV